MNGRFIRFLIQKRAAARLRSFALTLDVRRTTEYDEDENEDEERVRR